MAYSANGAGKSGVNEAVSTLRHDVSAIGEDVRDVAKEIGKEARRKMESAREAGAARAAAAISQAEDTVRERPAAAIGLAAAAGFLLGVLIARR